MYVLDGQQIASQHGWSACGCIGTDMNMVATPHANVYFGGHRGFLE